MKKFIALFTAIILSLTAFAEEDDNRIRQLGLGFSVPFYTQNVKDDGKRQVENLLFDLNYIGINKISGLTIFLDTAFGYTTTKDIPLFDNKRKHGFGMDVDFGIGYSFIRNEDMTLSLLATYGISMYDITGNKTFGYKELELKDSIVTGTNSAAGLLFAFSRRIGKNLSLYAQTEARYIIGENESTSYSATDNSDVTYTLSLSRNITDGFEIVPRFGLCFKL